MAPPLSFVIIQRNVQRGEGRASELSIKPSLATEIPHGSDRVTEAGEGEAKPKRQMPLLAVGQGGPHGQGSGWPGVHCIREMLAGEPIRGPLHVVQPLQGSVEKPAALPYCLPPFFHKALLCNDTSITQAHQEDRILQIFRGEVGGKAT